MIQHCRSCAGWKDASAFYASNKSRCKDCVKASAAAHRLANLEAVRAYDRLRGGQAHRVAARKEYQRTPAFAQSHDAAAKRWAAKHPERRSAQVALGNAIRDGKVTPWPVCAVPECSDKPEAHHPDYSAPLAVVWLCTPHHRATHAITATPESPTC